MSCVRVRLIDYGLRRYEGAQDRAWGGDPSHAHEWGAMERGRRKDVLPAETSAAGRLASVPAQEGALNNGGRFCACGAWRGSLGGEPKPDCLAWARGEPPCPSCYVCHMRTCFAEVRRVLRDDATCWVVLGDSFGRGRCPAWEGDARRGINRRKAWVGYAEGVPQDEGQDGNLLGMPWRVALALQADGWALRNDITWAKRAALPESVAGWRWERHRVKVARGEVGRDGLAGSGRRPHGATLSEPSRVAYDPARPQQNHAHGAQHSEFAPRAEWRDCPGCERCAPNDGLVLRRGSWRHTRATETVLMLAKNMGYYADAEAVKEPLAPASVARLSQVRLMEQTGGDGGNGVNRSRSARRTLENLAARYRSGNKERWLPGEGGERGRLNDHRASSGFPWEDDGGGRNPRNFVLLGPEPFAGAHFATYPQSLIEPLILASTSARGVCRNCGAPHARVVERHRTLGWRASCSCSELACAKCDGPLSSLPENGVPVRACPCCGGALVRRSPGPVAAVVLDPFVGSGTTLRAAVKHGRRAVGCDLSRAYLRDLADARARGVQREMGL